MNKLKQLFETWYEPLEDFLNSTEFSNISKVIKTERKKNIIYPPKGSDLFFKMFRTTPYDEAKVIILGMDPYNGDNQFDGLAFSNSTQIRPQPSLKFILKEVEDDIYDGCNPDRVANYSLYNWAEQGVLLINIAHTVVKGNAGLHLKYWRPFTLKVIEAINKKNNIIWILWGSYAKRYLEFITNKSHGIIEAAHPAAEYYKKNAGFLGSKCFSKCNNELLARNLKEIIW